MLLARSNRPVQTPRLSPAGVPTPIALLEPNRGVFPVIHTPYSYYEKI
jgi:hypothetical protein